MVYLFRKGILLNLAFNLLVANRNNKFQIFIESKQLIVYWFSQVIVAHLFIHSFIIKHPMNFLISRNFYKNISASFLIIAAMQNKVFAEELSYFDQPREDLLFIQELKDTSTEAAEKPREASDLFKLQPKISNKLIADINFDDNYASTSKQNEYHQLQTNIRFVSKLDLNKNFFIRSFIRLSESSQAAETARRNASLNGSGDRSFENLGLTLEELVVGFKEDHFGIVAGKFNLNFGTVWQQSFGIWYADIAKQYRQREKLGMRANYNFGGDQNYGSHILTLSTFTNDRKNFDNALINKRDSVSKQSGTPGDTRSLFDSYCASLNSKWKLNKKDEITYHISYINLGVNERASPIIGAKISDQKGLANAISYKSIISDNFGFNVFAEYTEIKNLGGNSTINEKYLTTSATAEFYQQFNFTLARANQKNITVSNNGFESTLLEASVGYGFKESSFLKGLFLQAGFKRQRSGGFASALDQRNARGIMAIYSKEF